MLRVVVRSEPARAVCFDLENRPSAYWYDGETTSEITAFGWKTLDEPDVHSMVLLRDGRFRDETGRCLSERRAYDRFVRVLCSAGLVYGHNIRRHDLPMLNAWLVHRLQLPSLPELRTTDTLKDLPRTAGVSRSLENMADRYDLGRAKLKMSQADWERANRLQPDGVEKARARVESDVLLQEALMLRLAERRLLKPARWWRP